MKVLCLLALMAAATVNAVTPLDFIPSRYQGGAIYKKAVEETSERAAVLKAATGHTHTRNTTDNFFDQYVDHKDKTRGTFKQRYFVDYSYWNGTGPVCLYISGENIAKGSPSGFIADYARSIGALMFTLEHRWYGESRLSKDYKDMALMDTLTIDNALADLVYFMDHADANIINKNATWFAVGGSYAGGLSAWLKTVYPNRIAAAWSSSGVTNPKHDYYEYEGHVVSVLPPLCAHTIRTAIAQVEKEWGTPARMAELQAMFGAANMTKTEFSYLLGDIYSGPVQYGTKADMCDMLVPISADPLAQFAAMNRKLNGPQFARKFAAARLNKQPADLAAYPSLEGASNGLLGATLEEEPNMSGWLWNFQCCSEMAFWQIGYPSIGTKGTCLRPASLTTDGFMDWCARDYGDKYFPDVYALRKRLGGAFPNATQVIAFQASDDPFAPAGVMSEVSKDYPFVMAQCDSCAHCFDLRDYKPTEPASLTEARMTIVQYMNKWLGFANNVTFTFETAAPTAAAFQATLAAAIGRSSDISDTISAMVYRCDGDKCFSTFTSKKESIDTIALAKAGNITGVTDAYTSVEPKGDGEDEDGISRGVLVGVVIGGVVGLLLLIGGAAIVIKKRRASAESNYHSVNDH